MTDNTSNSKEETNPGFFTISDIDKSLVEKENKREIACWNIVGKTCKHCGGNVFNLSVIGYGYTEESCTHCGKPYRIFRKPVKIEEIIRFRNEHIPLNKKRYKTPLAWVLEDLEC